MAPKPAKRDYAAEFEVAATSYTHFYETLIPIYHDVVIVGTGVSAIAMAIQLKRGLGVSDVLLIDKEGGIGGTWYSNSYPGCACDIPALLYSYSFMQSGNWSKFHPERPELRAYFEKCASEYDVPQRCQLNTTVREARFDDSTGLWHVLSEENQASGGENSETKKFHYVSKILVSAVGGLSVPNKCQIKGHETFEGDLFHSARWDHSVSLKSRDVVVVGNGCTATQFVPAIQPQVKSLTQFARSKHWIAPMPRNWFDCIPGWKFLVRWTGFARNVQRAAWFGFLEVGFRICLLGTFGNILRAYWRWDCKRHIKSLAPEKYWDALIPNDRELTVAVKRRIFDSAYLRCLNAPNIELIGEQLESMGPDYVVTKDGRKIHADVVILATGFATARVGAPMMTYGSKGVEQREHWEKYGNGGPFHYRSSMMANFPNMGFLMGSNSTTGHTSVIFTSESQIGFLLEVFKPILAAETPTWKAINHVPDSARGGKSSSSATSVARISANERSPSVVPSLEADLNDLNWISKEMTKTVFMSSKSWYMDQRSGRVTAMHPTSQIAMRRRLNYPDWRDFEYRNLPGKGDRVVHTPPTAPLYKRLASAVLGLGRVDKVLPSDPAIQYAKPYTGPGVPHK